MKRQAFIFKVMAAAALVASFALARTTTVPPLPVSPFADTGSSTNVVFYADVAGDGVFAVSIELDASPSNNVEVAFGRDADGDGALDIAERAFAIGWDCGEWFFRDAVADVAGSCAGPCGRVKFDWRIRLDSGLRPTTLRAFTGGASLSFPVMETMYDPEWNMACVMARGFGESGAVVRFGALREALTIRLR